jgi:hypothetical protein
MAKIRCTCGHSIVDQTGNLPYKAYFFRDSDKDSYYDFTDEVGSFIESIKNNTRDEWITSYFPNAYPKDEPDAFVIADIITFKQRKFISDMYQCENCGRVLIQKGNQNIFPVFKPEDDHSEALFESIN